MDVRLRIWNLVFFRSPIYRLRWKEWVEYRHIRGMDWDWKCNLRKFSGVENTRQADKAHDPSPGRQDDAGIL